MKHPLQAALLRRAAGISGDCPDTERDAILKRLFPHLDRETTMRQLRIAHEHHVARRGVEAERIINDLIGVDE